MKQPEVPSSEPEQDANNDPHKIEQGSTLKSFLYPLIASALVTTQMPAEGAQVTEKDKQTVTARLEKLKQTIAQGEEVTLPDGRKFKLSEPLKNISEKDIRDLLYAIFADGGVKGYEELMRSSVLFLQQQRLRQSKNTPNDTGGRLSNAYWETRNEFIPSHVIRYYQEMQRYSQYASKYGVMRTPDIEFWEKAAAEHAQALSVNVEHCVKLGNFAQLILMANEYRDLAANAKDENVRKECAERLPQLLAAIQQAKQQLPAIISVLPGSTAASQQDRLPEGLANGQMLRTAIENADTDPKQFLALQKMRAVLANETTWILNFKKGVPGAPEEGMLTELKQRVQKLLGVEIDMRGMLPAEVLQVQVLTQAMEASTEKEIKARRAKDEPGTAAAVAERREIQKEMIMTMRRHGASRIADIKLLSVHHAFGDVMQGEADRKSAPSPSKEANEKYIHDALDHEIGKVRGHFNDILESGGALSLNMTDRAENIWNKNRGRMNVFFEWLVAIRVSPRHLVSKIPGVDSPDKARADIMGDVRKELGYPEGYDPLLTEEENTVKLTPADKKKIFEKMDSVMDTVKTYRPQFEEHKQKMDASLDLLQKVMLKDPEMNADALMDSDAASPEEIQPYLEGGLLTPASLQRIRALPDQAQRQKLYVAAYGVLFGQLENQWNAHMDTAAQYFGRLEDILEVHIATGDAYKKAGDKSEWPWFWTFVAIGGVAVVGAYLKYRQWTAKSREKKATIKAERRAEQFKKERDEANEKLKQEQEKNKKKGPTEAKNLGTLNIPPSDILDGARRRNFASVVERTPNGYSYTFSPDGVTITGAGPGGRFEAKYTAQGLTLLSGAETDIELGRVRAVMQDLFLRNLTPPEMRGFTIKFNQPAASAAPRITPPSGGNRGIKEQPSPYAREGGAGGRPVDEKGVPGERPKDLKDERLTPPEKPAKPLDLPDLKRPPDIKKGPKGRP